jgi:hypothetical protein
VLERGEEYDGRAAFGGQKRSIYAASGPGPGPAATTRPRQGRRRSGGGTGSVISSTTPKTTSIFNYLVKTSRAMPFRIIIRC